MISDWYTITVNALQNLWSAFILYIPNIIIALIIFIIGWLISVGIGKLVTEILKRVKFNKLFEKGVWKEALEKAEFKVDAAAFIGAVCKWILAIVALLIAVEILGLNQFANLLTKVLGYLPNVVVAALIFVVAVIISDIAEKVIRAAVGGVKASYANLAGGIVKWSIWIFTIFAVLIQLKVAEGVLMTLYTGIIALIVIAGGIAFGLGGKDVAADMLEDLKRRLKE